MEAKKGPWSLGGIKERSMPKDGRCWYVLERERTHWVLCLKSFYLFSTGRNFRGGLTGGSQ